CLGRGAAQGGEDDPRLPPPRLLERRDEPGLVVLEVVVGGELRAAVLGLAVPARLAPALGERGRLDAGAGGPTTHAARRGRSHGAPFSHALAARASAGRARALPRGRAGAAHPTLRSARSPAARNSAPGPQAATAGASRAEWPRDSATPSAAQ